MNDELKVGQRMPDGTIFAGISPDTNRPMYTTPADARLVLQWDAAMDRAAKLDAHGHQDWRVPTKNELNVLFANQAAIGGFDERGVYPAVGYWSSTEESPDLAWAERFSDGDQRWDVKINVASLR